MKSSRELDLINGQGAQQNKGQEGTASNVLSFERPAAAKKDDAARLNWFGRKSASVEADLVCLSHLRWDFVFQRPQHLLLRCARERRVFFVEEPIFGEGAPRLDVSRREEGVFVVVPHLPHGLDEATVERLQQAFIEQLFAQMEIHNHLLWYYTPMAIEWTRHLKPLAVIYDCMDELSAFRNAPRALREREAELFRRADLVFTGGQSLYEAKRDRHPNVYAFPSSIDRAHFAQAREMLADPQDQATIPHPRLGFFGVIDERLDVALLDQIAEARPDWHLVIIGPVVKIDEADLPRRPNIHYLGGKTYKELPDYIANWDVAALLFARNDSTRYISPTKTPEYLAAGKPVVSTSIRDVIRPYGELGLVRIADEADDFIKAAAEIGMDEMVERNEWLEKVDAFLAQNSWDRTWSHMSELIEQVAGRHLAARAQQGRGAAAGGGGGRQSSAATAAHQAAYTATGD
jgi:UDP-galactopyranose mutase